jgi:CheY-like chemotaxis protein
MGSLHEDNFKIGAINMNNSDTPIKRQRAFLVDDDKDTLAVMAYLFEAADVEVVKVNQSTNALDEFVSNSISGGSFDLIALDIRMPHIDGNELARQIREKGFKGPIVALTASATGGGRRESKECGFDHYFGKKELTTSLLLALLQK